MMKFISFLFQAIAIELCQEEVFTAERLQLISFGALLRVTLSLEHTEESVTSYTFDPRVVRKLAQAKVYTASYMEFVT